MKELIEKVMTWNTYPDQNPVWSGWEYVPTEEVDIETLAKVVGVDDTHWVESACLQIDDDEYNVYVDGNVWQVTEKEFTSFLERLVK